MGGRERRGKVGSNVTYASEDAGAGARFAFFGVADGEGVAREEGVWDACCGGGEGDGEDGNGGLHFG